MKKKLITLCILLCTLVLLIFQLYTVRLRQFLAAHYRRSHLRFVTRRSDRNRFQKGARQKDLHSRGNRIHPVTLPIALRNRLLFHRRRTYLAHPDRRNGDNDVGQGYVTVLLKIENTHTNSQKSAVATDSCIIVG